MSLNQVIVNGKLPRFEPSYKKGEGDKKSFLAWAISIRRDMKPADAQYYPEDLFRFKAFGQRADFIMNNFEQGDGLIIVGKLQKEDDYEKDGQTVSGGTVILVDTVSFADAKTSNASNSNTGSTSMPAVPGAGAKPVVPGATSKPTIPGATSGIPGNKPAIPGSKPNFSNGRPQPPTFNR